MQQPSSSKPEHKMVQAQSILEFPMNPYMIDLEPLITLGCQDNHYRPPDTVPPQSTWYVCFFLDVFFSLN